MTHDGTQEARDPGEHSLPSIPAMPAVPRSQLSRGRPHLLVEYRLRHSLGWQDHKTEGPGFVIVRLNRLDRAQVISRFALTNQGWESAWRALSSLDAEAAAAIRSKISTTAERHSTAAMLAELDARTECRLRYMTYNGGSSDSPIVPGRYYDLRFLGDRLMVCPSGSATAVAELAYHDLEAVDVSESGRSGSPAVPLAVTLGAALVGALIGLAIHRLLGLILGAMICGLIGAVAMAASTMTKTIVRLRSQDAEFFFLSTDRAAEAIRIALSGSLTAIERARTTRPGGSGKPVERRSDSIPDQLGKLASLLADGVLSREEFERLKAKVIAQP